MVGVMHFGGIVGPWSVVPWVEVEGKVEGDFLSSHVRNGGLAGPNPSEGPETSQVQDDGIRGVEDLGNSLVPVVCDVLQAGSRARGRRSKRRLLHEFNGGLEFFTDAYGPVCPIPDLPPLEQQEDVLLTHAGTAGRCGQTKDECRISTGCRC